MTQGEYVDIREGSCHITSMPYPSLDYGMFGM